MKIHGNVVYSFARQFDNANTSYFHRDESMLRQISWLIMVSHFRGYSMSESIPLLTWTSASACERVANYTGQIGRPFSAGIMMQSLTNDISGEGLQSQFPSFRYFPIFPNHRNTCYLLTIMFILDRIWHSLAVVHFCNIENFPNGQINERMLSNPTPKLLL